MPSLCSATKKEKKNRKEEKKRTKNEKKKKREPQGRNFSRAVFMLAKAVI